MKNIILVLAFVSLTGLAAPLSAHADAASSPAVAANPDFYRLQPAVVKEVPPTPEELYSGALDAPSVNMPNLQTFAIDWGTMVAIGEKVIQIVQAGKPVVNITRDAVAVVPSGVTAWNQLAGWQAPVTKVYSVTAQNYLGLTVVDLRLKVSAMYGGGFNGHGKYLANVLVVPSSVYVLWGFSCDVWAEHRDPVNVGAQDNPVAGLGFDIRYRYGSPLAEEVGTQDYFVTGAGQIQELQ
jgi:hypothetical protein